MKNYYQAFARIITAPLWLVIFIACLLVGFIYVVLMLPVIITDALKEVMPC